MDFLKTLWINHIFSIIMVPWNYSRDEKLRRWLHAYEALDLQRARPQKEQEQAAVTDDMSAPSQGPVSVTNPRWEHVDNQKKNDTPDIADIGDPVMLKADITGIPEGAGVDFDIFDTASSSPARAIERVHTRLRGGTAAAQWNIKDTPSADESRQVNPEFEAIARDKSSERCAIPLSETISLRLNINPTEEQSQDDVYILFSTDAAQTYRQEKTVKDDQIPGDEYLDLRFTGLRSNLSYTLEINSGKEGKSYMFENRPFKELGNA
jgi:hypothetical protein